MPQITVQTQTEKIKGLRYLWMKRVTGFNPKVHCAQCLKGHYVAVVGREMATNRTLKFQAWPGDIFYLCGVSSPYKWENNFHLAFKATDSMDDRCHVFSHTGDKFEIEGAIELPFDDTEARERFPNLSEPFLTCRNFQFAAQYFE